MHLSYCLGSLMNVLAGVMNASMKLRKHILDIAQMKLKYLKLRESDMAWYVWYSMAIAIKAKIIKN